MGRAHVRGESIQVRYRNRTVVDVDAISLPAGKTFALLGASGAGKSTLLRVLGLLERPSSGRVFFDGTPARRSSLATRRTIAAVFQKPYLLRGTVGDNVAYGLRLRRVSRSERKARLAEALDRVGLHGWQDRSALTLSGGEAQRVALARALVLQPTLLLLDEPLSYMDPLLKRQLSLEFAQILADEGTTALYVTHDQDEAAVVADRVAVMRDGRIVAEGDAESVLAAPTDEWVAAFFNTETALPGTVATSDGGIVTVDCAGAVISAASDLPAGASVLLGVRPEDVLLFERGVQLPDTAARNHVEGVVAEVVPIGIMARVVVDVSGCRLSALVSRSSVRSLQLEPGVPVTAVFDAAAVHVSLRVSAGGGL